MLFSFLIVLFTSFSAKDQAIDITGERLNVTISSGFWVFVPYLCLHFIFLLLVSVVCNKIYSLKQIVFNFIYL